MLPGSRGSLPNLVLGLALYSGQLPRSSPVQALSAEASGRGERRRARPSSSCWTVLGTPRPGLGLEGLEGWAGFGTHRPGLGLNGLGMLGVAPRRCSTVGRRGSASNYAARKGKYSRASTPETQLVRSSLFHDEQAVQEVGNPTHLWQGEGHVGQGEGDVGKNNTAIMH